MLKQIIEIIIEFQGFFNIDSITQFGGPSEVKEDLRREVKWRLDRLEREGLIKRIKVNGIKPQGGSNPGRPTINILYTARKNALKKRLAELTARQKPDTAWDKMWRAIRVMRKFTRGDLVQLTGAADQNVKDFIKLLVREKFVKRVSAPGKIPEVLFLCQDPGPQRPRISKKDVQGERHDMD